MSGVSGGLGVAKILVLVIESGMIYSAALIIEIACYFAGSNAFYILYDPIAQLTVSPVHSFSPCSSLSFRHGQSIVPTMILLLVGFRQTSNDIRTRATATTKVHGALPTVNFRTNPDLATTAADLRMTEFTAPRVTFGSLHPTSSSESASRVDSFKSAVVDLDPRLSTTSEKNV